MGLCFLGTRCEKELLVCRKCCALQSLQKKEKMQSAPTCGLQDCTDDCDLLSSGGSLLSTALTQTEVKSHSFHLKGSPLSAASQRDQRSHCLQGWWGFKDSKETNEKLIREAPTTWGLFSCLTSAVMGELAMPNVLSTQIAWLHLFESCYLLPLISKVPAIQCSSSCPATSTSEKSTVVSSQGTREHMALERKEWEMHSTMCCSRSSVSCTSHYYQISLESSGRRSLRCFPRTAGFYSSGNNGWAGRHGVCMPGRKWELVWEETKAYNSSIRR